MDKSSTADAISNAEPWPSHTCDDLEVHRLGAVVTLTYAATGNRSDSETYEALISTTYVRDGASWKL